MQCRDQIATLKCLAISCGKLDIHGSYMPSGEEVLILRFLAINDCTESNRTTKRLKACKNMKVKLKDQVEGLQGEKFYWFCASKIHESADPDDPDFFWPKSTAILELLQEHHPSVYMPNWAHSQVWCSIAILTVLSAYVTLTGIFDWVNMQSLREYVKPGV